MSNEPFKALLEEYVNLKEENKRLLHQNKLMQKEISSQVKASKPKADLYTISSNNQTANLVVGGGITPKWGLTDFEYDTGHVVVRDDSHNWG